MPFKRNDLVDIIDNTELRHTRCMLIHYEEPIAKVILPGQVDPFTTRVFSIEGSRIQEGDVVRSTGRLTEATTGSVLPPGTLWKVTKIGKSSASCQAVPLDKSALVADEVLLVETRMGCNYLRPILKPRFSPGQKVVVGTEEGPRRGVVLANDPEGVVVEFSDPVGEHSYDGMGKRRHCSIIEVSRLEVAE